ncbi:hypothetical protein Nepgr_003913 [Nepenthes gracilis]|uniref:Uncharacterized protein n=1 Tax=Nepenthes gracilis TaxID=150966 RepID=A0AAD3S0I1_NEPGR|nr:hypothetical protein Nepgr_003913 [Nepenthes gracilis]
MPLLVWYISRIGGCWKVVVCPVWCPKVVAHLPGMADVYFGWFGVAASLVSCLYGPFAWYAVSCLASMELACLEGLPHYAFCRNAP